jgi:hypothetical protein
MYHSLAYPGLVFHLLDRTFAVISPRENAFLRLWSAVALSLGLFAGTVLPCHAQPALSDAPAAAPCEAATVAYGTQQGQAIEATVTRVDPGHGQIEFTTETGTFLLTTTAELHDLHVGDRLLLCLHTDVNEDGARVAQEAPTATAQPSETLRKLAEPTPEPLTKEEPGESRHE